MEGATEARRESEQQQGEEEAMWEAGSRSDPLRLKERASNNKGKREKWARRDQ